MTQRLQPLGSGSREPSLFQKRFLDTMFSRYFVALHVPFFSLAFTEPTYAFSRKTVVEMSLKAYYCARPQAVVMQDPLESPSLARPGSAGIDEFARLSLTGGGFFRYIPHQANVLIAVELQNQLHEDRGFCTPTARPDLLNVLKDGKEWALQRIQAGETNVKGYLLAVALSAHVDATLQGMGKDECAQCMVSRTREAGRLCLDILRQIADGIAPELSPNINQAELGPVDGGDDWDDDWDAVGSNQRGLIGVHRCD